MNRTDYLQAVCDSQISPMEVFMKQQESPDFYYIVDVRIGPKEFKGNKIAGAVEIPLSELPQKLDSLPRDKKIAVATWGVQCTLAKAASLMLLSAGFDVVEIGGASGSGSSSWLQQRRRRQLAMLCRLLDPSVLASQGRMGHPHPHPTVHRAGIRPYREA